MKSGWQPEVFTDLAKAAKSIGFFTRAVITAVVPHPSQYQIGLSPFEVTNVLEIPRAVLLDHDMDAEQFVRVDMRDVVVSRHDSDRIVPLLRVWLESIEQIH